jgi:hypothetical protein
MRGGVVDNPRFVDTRSVVESCTNQSIFSVVGEEEGSLTKRDKKACKVLDGRVLHREEDGVSNDSENVEKE